MVEQQLRALEKTRTERIASADSHPLQQVVQLMGLRAIGPTCAWLLVMGFFAWRGLRNAVSSGRARA